MRRYVAKTKSCPRTGKVAFRDEESAKRAIKHTASISTREVVPVRHYKCPFCKHWHLTSKED